MTKESVEQNRTCIYPKEPLLKMLYTQEMYK